MNPKDQKDQFEYMYPDFPIQDHQADAVRYAIEQALMASNQHGATPAAEPKPEPLSGEILDRMAMSLVGDGKEPDLFFVTVDGTCKLVSTDFELAHLVYSRLVDEFDSADPFSDQSSFCLESRSWGVITSVDYENGRRDTRDDSDVFRRQLAVRRRQAEILFQNKKIK